MTEIHPTAVVSPGAKLASDVKIGPYAIIGENVSIGNATQIDSHVVIEGRTQIGERNRISPFSCIGTPPQDVGYQGEDTRVTIGDDNVIREYVTIHRATTKENEETIVGNHNFIMAYAHVAHDCVLGDNIILANAVTLGGHTRVGDHANIGGLAAAHQFVRIGAYAFIGGLTGMPQDIPPFVIAAGPRARLFGINQIGMSRSGFSKETVAGLKRAYRIIWKDNRRFSQGIEQVRKEMKSFPELDELLEFLEHSKRGIAR